MAEQHKKQLSITMLGMTTINILGPLAGLIKAADSTVRLKSVGLRSLKSGADEVVDRDGSYGFDECVASALKALPGQKIRAKILNTEKAKNNLFTSKVRAFLSRNIKSLLYSGKIKQQIEESRKTSDVIHLHGLFWSPFHKALSQKDYGPLIISCWGSDVLRTSDIKITEKQQQLLRRASCITVSGPEFKEVVLSKYGRDLEDKIKFTIFGPDLQNIPEGDKEKGSKRFRENNQISDEKIVIAIGHNGHPEGQHLELLKSVNCVGGEMRERLYVVLQMTYGCDEGYLNEVRAALKAYGLEGMVIDEYMSDEDVSDLRFTSDIFLYAPVSDAFSASVTQALAAGSVAILGSWLPYKTRSRAGFKYWEIDDPAGASQAITDVLSDWPKQKQVCVSNRKLASEFFDSSRLGGLWISAYEDALKNYSSSK